MIKDAMVFMIKDTMIIYDKRYHDNFTNVGTKVDMFRAQKKLFFTLQRHDTSHTNF